MSATHERDLSTVAAHFELEGDFDAGEPYGTGHINDTFAVTVRTAAPPARYIFQRVNHRVFGNVPLLMENIRRVTDHIRGGLPAGNRDAGRETLTIIPTREGADYWQDGGGDYWRVYTFIEGARTYDEVQSRNHAYQAAYAFGTFQKRLLDLPGSPLVETIPDFHHTPARFAKLISALRADSENRAAEAKAEIDFALAREDATRRLVDLIDAGKLPLRVTHNDTKINNVMINDADGRGLCVIDLDTVMPGTVLYDFGDQVRTTTGTAAEDERDLSKVTFQIEMFDALVHGYLDAAREFLTAEELGRLAFCGRLITFEIGIRFLTDFLEGDVYFKTHRPGHNLDRTRTQFEMVRQMEALEEDLEATVAAYR